MYIYMHMYIIYKAFLIYIYICKFLQIVQKKSALVIILLDFLPV